MITRAYENGMKAYSQGRGILDCPYPWWHPRKRWWWQKGYSDARTNYLRGSE